ncbi:MULTISPECIES: hypothetical protein [Providencia]|uniref:Uncharacterized protein n=2 Tax=Providencia TaxID=586 RepID=A0AA42FDI2_9GAMM|nr:MULTISPECIES: hypothetical protein [Providencia]MBC8653487.1 hypothetical protein [Providencia vermicola]HCI95058.1 hypothetical protein [Providencia sp.]APC12069.1 hypothetical protein RB151_023980 [Providencia rettgeri]AVL75376.1 hypothetical protein CEQ08_17350 [Providencia rettgeri]EIL1984910.1 hypothetical protein [Providencia rettgeri]
MDILEKTLVFGNDFMTTTNPARLVAFKFEIYRSEQGFYHRIYKEVGMSGANLGQLFKVWAFEEQKCWEKQTSTTTLDEYVQYCQDIYKRNNV